MPIKSFHELSLGVENFSEIDDILVFQFTKLENDKLKHIHKIIEDFEKN